MTLAVSNVLRRCLISSSSQLVSRCAPAGVSHHLKRTSLSVSQLRPQFQRLRHFSGSPICSRMAPTGQEESPAKVVDSLIADNAVAIFSKSYCPFCTKIKNFFTEKKIAFKSIELDTVGDLGAEIQALLLERTSQSTVPSVWVNGKFIGEPSLLVFPCYFGPFPPPSCATQSLA